MARDMMDNVAQFFQQNRTAIAKIMMLAMACVLFRCCFDSLAEYAATAEKQDYCRDVLPPVAFLIYLSYALHTSSQRSQHRAESSPEHKSTDSDEEKPPGSPVQRLNTAQQSTESKGKKCEDQTDQKKAQNRDRRA